EHDEHRADRNNLALADEDARDASRRGRRNLDRRLVGLQFDERLVLRHLVALGNEPARDLALGQPLAEVRQLELERHRYSATRATAARMRSTDGRYASSSFQYGNGTS